MHITAQKCALQNACPRHESGHVFNLNSMRAVARRKRHTSNYRERAPELSDATRGVLFSKARGLPCFCIGNRNVLLKRHGVVCLMRDETHSAWGSDHSFKKTFCLMNISPTNLLSHEPTLWFRRHQLFDLGAPSFYGHSHKVFE